jgi:hypothetical protein
MNFILQLKHWQVFLILLVASFTSNFTWVDEDKFNLVINSIGGIIYFLWYFIVGLELTERLPPRVELSKTIFIINAFVLLVSFAVINVVYNGFFTSNGLLGSIWVLYLMYAIIQFLFYPSKALKSVEQGTEATLGEYIKYFFLILFWPFGIWWIQPKLNNIGRNSSQ